MAGFEATGARMPQRELYHARLSAAYEARDMAAYYIALKRVRGSCPRGITLPGMPEGEDGRPREGVGRERQDTRRTP
jgi:hypothetical protein